MYGNLVSTPTAEIVIELQFIGEEVLVTARQSTDRSSNGRIIATIRKGKNYDDFNIILGNRTKVITLLDEEKRE